MQPAPSPQDNTAIRAGIAWTADQLEAPVHDAIVAFAGQLTDPLARDFLRLLNTLDTAYRHVANRQEGKAWEVITLHLPGLAPVLDVLRCHLQADQPLCERDGRQPPNNHTCRYANEVRYEG